MKVTNWILITDVAKYDCNDVENSDNCTDLYFWIRFDASLFFSSKL